LDGQSFPGIFSKMKERLRIFQDVSFTFERSVHIDKKNNFFKLYQCCRVKNVNVAPAGPGKNFDTASTGPASSGPALAGSASAATDHGGSDPAIRFAKKNHFYADHHY
jgi:hypothetical protein